MQDDPDAANLRRDLFQCLQPLASDCIFQNGETREVSAGLRHVRNVATAERIADDHEYNWYGACFLLQDRRYLIRTGHDHVRFIPISSLAKVRAMSGLPPAQR